MAHYSYSKQEEGMRNHTNLLERYLNRSAALDVHCEKELDIARVRNPT